MDPLDEIRRQIEASRIIYNTSPIEDFEGLSPADMRYFLYDPFSIDSPFKLKNNIPDNILDQIPMFIQVEYLLNRINDLGEIKLTATGALPTPMVKELYNQGLIKDYAIEKGYRRLFGEASCLPVHLTRIIVEISGFAKKKKGKLSLTNTWKNKLISKNRQDIFFQVFSSYSQKFNWGYLDSYPSQQTGQLGFAFTLLLLSKYGKIERLDKFYSDKYLKAFPKLSQDFNTGYFIDKSDEHFHDCYSYRTFDRFLGYFNMIESRTEGKYTPESKKFIKKTALYDHIVFFDN
jgi:hypothetical protein